MVLTFPTRVSIPLTLLFAALLVLVEQLEGTDPRYSGLVFCFFILSAFAFNLAGGFSRPSGAYVFFYSALVVEIGTVYKAFLGQPAQSNLLEPLLMMGIYVASIAGLLLVVFVIRKIATTTEGIAGILKVTTVNYTEAATGCAILFCVLTFGPALLPELGGQLLHSLQLINVFLPFAMLLGAIGAVQDSGGRRCMNTITWLTMTWYFFSFGLLGFSKQGMFTPIVCWVLGLAWARYRLRLVNLIFIAGFMFAAQTFLVPLAQVGRDEIYTGDYSERVGIVEHYLFNPSELREKTDTWAPQSDIDSHLYYYGEPRGIIDRLSMMPNDALLMEWTDQGHQFGYLAIEYYVGNLVPHIISPHKLEGVQVGGNAYMHEMGGLADADTTTGISFSPSGEAFHIDAWRGVLLLAPAVWFVTLLVADSLCGDIRKQPLGLLYILAFAHLAPEGGLGAAIDGLRLLNAAFVVGVFFCGYIAPTLGVLLKGRGTLANDRPLHRPGAANFDSEALSPS